MFKPMLQGCVDIRGFVPTNVSGVPNTTIEIEWARLEPTEGTYDFSALDAALKRAGTALVLLRIFAGIHAPDWLKAKGSVHVAEPQGNLSGDAPLWWKWEVGIAWQRLNTALGKKYDSNPQIREVTCSRSMTVYAEPMMRGGVANKSALEAAGFTEAADIASYVQGAVEMTWGWRTTRISFACNPYQSQFGSNGIALTLATITALRAALGKHLVLCNNSLRSPVTRLGSDYAEMYAAMAKSTPCGYQTATLDRIGSVADTLAIAVHLNGGRVELPGGWETAIDSAALEPYNEQLAANAVSTQ